MGPTPNALLRTLSLIERYRISPEIRLRNAAERLLGPRPWIAWDSSALIDLLNARPFSQTPFVREFAKRDMVFCIPMEVLSELMTFSDQRKKVQQTRDLVAIIREIGFEKVQVTAGLLDCLDAELKSRSLPLLSIPDLVERIATEQDLENAVHDPEWTQARKDQAKENDKRIRGSHVHFEEWRQQQGPEPIVERVNETLRVFQTPGNDFHLLSEHLADAGSKLTATQIYSSRVDEFPSTKMYFSLVWLHWTAHVLPPATQPFPLPLQFFRSRNTRNDLGDYVIAASAAHCSYLVTKDERLARRINFLALNLGLTHLHALTPAGLLWHFSKHPLAQ